MVGEIPCDCVWMSIIQVVYLARQIGCDGEIVDSQVLVLACSGGAFEMQSGKVMGFPHADNPLAVLFSLNYGLLH